MFSSLKSVTSVVTVCTITNLLLGLFTLALSITASLDNDFVHFAVFPYSIPAEYTISLLGLASFSLGLYMSRSPPRQRLIVDVFQVVNAVSASVVLLSIALKLNELVSHVWRVKILHEAGESYWRFWVWWCVVFGSAAMLGVAACFNVLCARAYIKLNFMDSRTATEFLNGEVNILKCTSVAQLAAGLTLFGISVFGMIDEHFRWFDLRKTDLLWYSAVLEIIAALLTVYSGAKGWTLIKSSTRTKRQFDVLSTVNIAICVVVILILALATLTALTISIGFTYQLRIPELWHYYTANGLAALVAVVVILVLSVTTVKVSMSASGWIAPVEMEDVKIRFASGVNTVL